MEKIDIQSGIGYFDLDVFIQMNNYIIDVFYITNEDICPTATIDSRERYELNIFYHGDAVLTHNDETHEIHSGSYVLVPPNIEYQIETSKQNPPQKMVISFVIDELNLEKINANLLMYQDDVNRLFKTLTANKIVYGHSATIVETSMQTWRMLLAEFNTSYAVQREYFKSNIHNSIYSNNLIQEMNTLVIGSKSKQNYYFSSIFIDFLRATTDKSETVSITQQQPLTPYWLKYTIGVILENDYRDISLESLALRLSLSPRQIQRYLAKYYNMTFKEKLTTHRIEKAKEMLKSTNMSIEEIGIAVGFKSRNYFLKVFKDVVGLTPSKYKKNC